MSSGVYLNNFMIIFYGMAEREEGENRENDVHYLDDFRK